MISNKQSLVPKNATLCTSDEIYYYLQDPQNIISISCAIVLRISLIK